MISPISSIPRSAHRQRPEATPYVDLTRAEWSALRDKTPLPLTAEEVEKLRGLGDVIDLDEVRDIYLPLSRLLNLYIGATDGLRGALNTFLGEQGAQTGTPFVIGVAGSVAVGKSTVARLLQALLSRWPEHPRVELVTTDGFLLPTEELTARGLMSRKGFPESYDRRALTRFVADIKAGKDEVTAPVYSHLIYDIVPGEKLTVRRADDEGMPEGGPRMRGWKSSQASVLAGRRHEKFTETGREAPSRRASRCRPAAPGVYRTTQHQCVVCIVRALFTRAHSSARAAYSPRLRRPLPRHARPGPGAAATPNRPWCTVASCRGTPIPADWRGCIALSS